MHTQDVGIVVTQIFSLSQNIVMQPIWLTSLEVSFCESLPLHSQTPLELHGIQSDIYEHYRHPERGHVISSQYTYFCEHF